MQDLVLVLEFLVLLGDLGDFALDFPDVCSQLLDLLGLGLAHLYGCLGSGHGLGSGGEWVVLVSEVAKGLSVDLSVGEAVLGGILRLRQVLELLLNQA